MSLEKLKLSKPLVSAMTDAGYLSPKEIQSKTISRIIGGQDFIAVGPEGCGKTTAYVLGVLMRLRYGTEEVPRVLILAPNKEKVEYIIAQFDLLNRNKTIKIIPLHAGTGIEELEDGADIVVATPDYARAVYLKLALNLNKIEMFIVDDAETMIKDNLQLPVSELARSIVKCQHVVFTEVVHHKLNHMLERFMIDAPVVEVKDYGEKKAEIIEQLLYNVPNYQTKLNLLSLLLQDKEQYKKVLVFVNTRLAAEKLYNTIGKQNSADIALLNPLFFDQEGFDDIADFKEMDEARVLIVANEGSSTIDLSGIECLIHFELPEEKETFLIRVIKNTTEQDNIKMAITFSSDIELVQVRKIEQVIGQPIPVAELPDQLKVDKVRQKSAKKKADSKIDNEPEWGGAFHQKKASNAKNYNYSAGEKAKMTYKNKKS